jgi:hypothetical protein
MNCKHAKKVKRGVKGGESLKEALHKFEALAIRTLDH